ncbi:MAG: rod shape-determining protein MreD [Oscillospiraceae bacterium]|nr:rod shape-determining protein MreD [Oscillospiraceae bacterium]
MKYRINLGGGYTRKMKIRIFLRWFFYALALVLLYSLMSSGTFGAWQPFLIISFAIGVAIHEHEFSSSIFGIFCGFMLDIAMGTLFGFFAVLMMPFCFLVSLLARNLIRVNFVNHLIATAITTLFSFSMHYLFTYVIWDVSSREIVILNVLLPSFIATVVTAPLMYLLSRLIWRKLTLDESSDLREALEEAAESADESKKERRRHKIDS